MDIMTQPEHLSRSEVAALFRVHPQTVGQWAERGWLPYFTTPGGQRRFYRADVESFMERNSTVRVTQPA